MSALRATPHPARAARVRPSPARGEGTGASRLTDPERKIWYALRGRRLAGAKFRRQVPVGPYVADFLCYEARLVIEVDGGQHAESAKDRRRDRWFADNEFRIL